MKRNAKSGRLYLGEENGGLGVGLEVLHDLAPAHRFFACNTVDLVFRGCSPIDNSERNPCLAEGGYDKVNLRGKPCENDHLLACVHAVPDNLHQSVKLGVVDLLRSVCIVQAEETAC